MKTATFMAASMLFAVSVVGAPAMAQMTDTTAPTTGMTMPPTASEHATPTMPMTAPAKMTDAEKMKMKSCMKMKADAMAMDAECGRLKAMHDAAMPKSKGM